MERKKIPRKGACLYNVFCYLTLLISVYQHAQNQVIRSCLEIAMSMKHDSLRYLTHSDQPELCIAKLDFCGMHY